MSKVEERLAALPGKLVELAAGQLDLLVGTTGVGAGVLGQVGERADEVGVELQTKSVVNGAQFEIDEGVVERGNTRAVELGAEAVPG